MGTGWNLTHDPGSATRLVANCALGPMERGALTFNYLNAGEFSMFFVVCLFVAKLIFAENSFSSTIRVKAPGPEVIKLFHAQLN